MPLSDSQAFRLLDKCSMSQIMRYVRYKQVNKSTAAKRSETAKKAADIRWATQKGKNILDEEKKK